MGSQTRSLAVGTISATDVPAPLVAVTGSSGAREWLHIMNTGASTIYIGPHSTGTPLSSTNGYPIPPQALANGITGEKIIENHSGGVYVVCASAQTATVKVLSQLN